MIQDFIRITILTISRHSIAHDIFKMRRDKRNALLEIAMAEKTRKLLKKYCVSKDHVYVSTNVSGGVG